MDKTYYNPECAIFRGGLISKPSIFHIARALSTVVL